MQDLCDDAAVLANNDSEETVSVSRCWKADKIVFSRTLSEATWTNTTVVSTDAVKAIQKLKKSAGKNLTVLGSGSLVTQLAQAGLIDEYQILLDPIIIGQGMPLFPTLQDPMPLVLVTSRAFKKGQLFPTYQPAGARSG